VITPAVFVALGGTTCFKIRCLCFVWDVEHVRACTHVLTTTTDLGTAAEGTEAAMVGAAAAAVAATAVEKETTVVWRQ